MLPGVTLGDVGPKNGANMIDNGWIRIEDVFIPYENLLDKIGGINE